MLESTGNIEDAKSHFAAATSLFAKPEAYFGLARMAWYEKDIDECIRQHEKGRVALFTVRDVLHYNPMDRYYIPAICASSAYIDKRMWRRAKRITEEGLTYAPQDAQLRGSLTKINAALARRNQPLDIIIHTARSLETWNANTPKERGIGGSETAAVMISKELAARGHKVRVYCYCEGLEGKFDGVEYISYEKFDYKTTICDVFVTSRRAATLIEGKVQARITALWMHDNHIGQTTPDLAKAMFRADLIMGVSPWHRDFIRKTYPFIDPTKIVATRNGIDKSKFNPNDPLPPKKQKLVFTSSPDRGLNLALDLFSRVKEEVKDAELHVYYGFDNALKTIAAAQSVNGLDHGLLSKEEIESMTKEIEFMTSKIEETKGVVMHGRVSQAQLANELLESKIWFYPTHFQESSCISVMEAQAAGCIPITTALAALNDNVHHGFLIKPPNISADKLQEKLQSAKDYQDAFVQKTIDILKNEGMRSNLAEAGRVEALKISGWEKVGEEWEESFLDLLQTPVT